MPVLEPLISGAGVSARAHHVHDLVASALATFLVLRL